MRNLKYFKIWLSMGILLILAIGYFSLVPDPPGIKPGLPHSDKFFHGLSYFLVTFWFLLLYLPSHRTVILGAFLLMGLLLEILQYFLPYRTFDLLDLMANASGSFLAALLGNTQYAQLLLTLEKKLGKALF